MRCSRHVALPLVLGLAATTACSSPSGVDNEDRTGTLGPSLIFSGTVVSTRTGEPIFGVTVWVDAPARGVSDSVATDVTGNYLTNGLRDPAPGDCAGLTLTFEKEGFRPLRITPSASCAPGVAEVSARLMPHPGTR